MYIFPIYYKIIYSSYEEWVFMKLRFRSLSIFTQIMIFTILIVISISMLSTVLLVSQFTSVITKKDRILVQNAGQKVYSTFHDYYTSLYNQRNYMHSPSNIADIITSTRSTPTRIYDLNNLSKINDYLKALTIADPDIEDVILFTADGKNSFSYSPVPDDTVYLGYDFNSLPYIEEFSGSDSTITAVYSPAPEYMSSYTQGKAKSVITFAAKIYNTDISASQSIVGYLLINYSLDTISDTYQEIDRTSDGIYFVVNAQKKIIYSNDASLLGQDYTTEQAFLNNLVFDQVVSLSGLNVAACLDTSKTSAATGIMILRAVIITVIGILFIIGIIVLIHRHYARKFSQLVSAMQTISTGDFSTLLPVTSSDEIGYLSQAFNTMSSTLNEYIRKTYLAETQRRTAQLYALQAQINPHFLANAMESIRMFALENDDYETAGMLEALGNLFRWITQFKQDIIYIEDELEYLEYYIDLQKFRFPERLFIHFDIPDDIYYLGIPKFTLQPVMENCLSHGFPATHPLILDIKFTVQDGMLNILLTDNGPGIPEDKLKQLNEHIREIKTYSEFGVALRNIHSRFQLLFGNEYGLNITSTLHLGTTVHITLPAKEKKELEKYV